MHKEMVDETEKCYVLLTIMNDGLLTIAQQRNKKNMKDIIKIVRLDEKKKQTKSKKKYRKSFM